MATLTARPCPICEEAITDADVDGFRPMAPGRTAHAACLLRLTVGSVAHQEKRCSCYGGPSPERPDDFSFREDALAAWRHFVEHHVEEEV